jgi:PHD/YefM family antitoxin component YafN of YafNO toxin-antitoxin module
MVVRLRKRLIWVDWEKWANNLHWGKIAAVASLGVKPMIPVKRAAFLPLEKLPRTPASDLKKLGWRGMMSALRSKGKILVTNHNEPEAVIIPVEEYDDLLRLAEQSEAQTEAALANLRHSFDERLSVLQGQSAATRLQSTIRARAKLDGKVKAGSDY